LLMSKKHLCKRLSRIPFGVELSVENLLKYRAKQRACPESATFGKSDGSGSGKAGELVAASAATRHFD
jgi:hypothetical protein